MRKGGRGGGGGGRRDILRRMKQAVLRRRFFFFLFLSSNTSQTTVCSETLLKDNQRLGDARRFSLDGILLVVQCPRTAVVMATVINQTTKYSLITGLSPDGKHVLIQIKPIYFPGFSRNFFKRLTSSYRPHGGLVVTAFTFTLQTTEQPSVLELLTFLL